MIYQGAMPGMDETKRVSEDRNYQMPLEILCEWYNCSRDCSNYREGKQRVVPRFPKMTPIELFPISWNSAMPNNVAPRLGHCQIIITVRICESSIVDLRWRCLVIRLGGAFHS